MTLQQLIEAMDEAGRIGEHPSDLHSLNKFLKAAAKYAWCIEEQARHDESLSAEEKFEDSRAYLAQAFDWALVAVFKASDG